jgi:hypothetical protein
MSTAGFKLAIPTSKRPQTQALDRAVTVIDKIPVALYNVVMFESG